MKECRIFLKKRNSSPSFFYPPAFLLAELGKAVSSSHVTGLEVGSDVFVLLRRKA